jgi:hypothetical protein
MKSEREPTIYRIPEVREPTLFDYIVQKIIPEIFKFTEYLTLSGFIYFLALKTKNSLLSAFAYVLYGGILWYVMDKNIAFIKKLEFRNVWVMRATSWALVGIGLVLLFGSLALVSQIATAQLGK